MASLTTGLIENIGGSGQRVFTKLSVRIHNKDLIKTGVRISGEYWNESCKEEYVLDLLQLAPGEVQTRSYYAQFDLLEFGFIASSDEVEISVWGEDQAGCLTAAQSLLPAELISFHKEPYSAEREAFPLKLDRLYILNPSGNYVSVIDEKTNTLIGNIYLGSGPFGVAVNTSANKVYVTNFGRNTLSVIDGATSAVITNVTVGSNPLGVGVNPVTNKVYVTNWKSHSVSVIDGFTHVVTATILVDAFPEGVGINSEANFIYITNHGSSTVSVINGNTNTVIHKIDLGVSIS